MSRQKKKRTEYIRIVSPLHNHLPPSGHAQAQDELLTNYPPCRPFQDWLLRTNQLHHSPPAPLTCIQVTVQNTPHRWLIDKQHWQDFEVKKIRHTSSIMICRIWSLTSTVGIIITVDFSNKKMSRCPWLKSKKQRWDIHYPFTLTRSTILTLIQFKNPQHHPGRPLLH